MAGRAFDVVVVGGGPAGAATAIALARRGLSSAIVERRAEPIARVGETLPPAVRMPLEALGLWESFVCDGHAPAVGNRSYWGSDRPGDVNFVASPYGHGWHIDRERFERTLLDAAVARGVTLFGGRQLEAISGDGRAWQVAIPERVAARFLVDASGRTSALARICGAERVSIDQLVAATMFLAPASRAASGGGEASGDAAFAAAEEEDDEEERRTSDPFGRVTLIEAMPDGWWYSAPLPGGRLVAAYMTDADIATRETVREPERWLRQARRTRATRERLNAYVVDGRPRIASANTSRLISIIGPGWLAVGDAAVSFDPLSSQGIITALESAIHAGDTIAAHLSDTVDASDARGEGHGPGTTGGALVTYAERITTVYREYLVERAQYYGTERRWPSSPFWARRQAHRKVLHHAASS